MAKSNIGVVVPTLNSAITLKWTLLSLASQAECNVEIVVVDSGSTDGTLEICEAWGIKTVFVPPGSIYGAVNEGTKYLTTKWVTYLNSDDLVFRDSYARLIAEGERRHADVVYGHCQYIDFAGRYVYCRNAAPEYLLPHLFRGGILGFAQPATVYLRTMFDMLDGFDVQFKQIADYDFFARAFRAQRRFRRLTKPDVVAFRVHTGQVSSNREQVQRETLRAMQLQPDSSRLSAQLSKNAWRLMNIPYYVNRLKSLVSIPNPRLGKSR
jgi:glycosyltransferase involved in cell wall biosynthesis